MGYEPYREIDEIQDGPQRMEALHKVAEEAFKRDLVRVTRTPTGVDLRIKVHEGFGAEGDDLVKLIASLMV
jgi:NADH:ubiquinone oxidoreductase subunit F (NADH-binding)